MIKRIQFLAVLTVLSLLCSTSTVKASHAAGAEITYAWVSGSTYTLTYKFYRDCNGINEPATITCCYWNTCGGGTNTVILNKAPGANGLEVGTGCPGFSSTCNGGTNPGYREWVYTATVTLPSQCNSWHFSASENARNQAIQNITGNGTASLWVETTFDNLAAQGNSSPFFTVKPVNYLCVNTPYTYNNGAVDPNGDSLSYELVMPSDQGGNCTGVPLQFTATNTPPVYNLLTNPIQTNNTFNINPSTGQMTFTPSVQQIAVLTVLVREWRNGVQIGSIMRDMQYVVLNCAAVQPGLSTDTTSLSGVNLVNGQVHGCATEPLSFCFDVTSTALAPVLIATDNHTIVAPGSTVTYTGQATSALTGCFNWTPGIADTGLTVLAITVKDSTCNPPGIILSNTFTIPIFVWPPTKAGPDTIICQVDSTMLYASGGTAWTWSVLPGGSPISSLSCTNCQYPMAQPLVSTYYVATSTAGNNFCGHNFDTVYVEVLPPPIIDVGADITTCIGESVQLNVNFVPDPNTTYTFDWQPNQYLNSNTVQNPVSTPTQDVTYYVTVIPGSTGACAGHDTLNVFVLQGFTLLTPDTSICAGNGVQIVALGDIRYTYDWSPALGVSDTTIINPYIAPPSFGIYDYTITASFPGCADSSQDIRLDAQPVPTVSVGADKIICFGDTLHMSPAVSPAYPLYTYVWSPSGAFSNPSVVDPIYTGLVTNTISLTVVTPAGCNGTDNAQYDVIQPNIIEVSNDTALCPGDTAQIHVTEAQGASLDFVIWKPAIYISDTSSLDPLVWPVTTMSYTVYGRDINYCLDSEIVTIVVQPEAVIALPDSVRIYPGESYQMDPDGNCLYFQWFPPVGLSDDDIANPIAMPEVNTRYYVNASTEFGCSTSDSIDVFVSQDSYIDVPNAFTPGSAPNATIKVVRNGIAVLKSFRIFNRWGVKVFESSNIDEGWDGTYGGKPQPMGVYIYTVDAMTPSGKKFVKQGNITLIR